MAPNISRLRDLLQHLNIEPWKIGLSEADTITWEVPMLYEQQFDAAEISIKRIWTLRRTTPVVDFVEDLKDIENILNYLATSAPPPIHLNARFLVLSAQLLRLKAVIDVEFQHYTEAREKFKQMHDIAVQSGDPGSIAMSLLGMGTEAERAGEQEQAIDLLEQARDESFNASKHIMVVTNAYLARAYASNGMAKEFHRTIDVALRIATSIKPHYGDGTDFVFHNLSGVMAEKSYGLVELGEAQACLDMAEELQAQIAAEGNRWLDAWIPWDWARAHLMLGNIQQSVEAAITFYKKAGGLRSPHAMNCAIELLVAMKDAGYGDRPEVQPFRALVAEQ